MGLSGCINALIIGYLWQGNGAAGTLKKICKKDARDIRSPFIRWPTKPSRLSIFDPVHISHELYFWYYVG
jgi:hypothetical protein